VDRTRTATAGLCHDALLYRTDAEFVDALEPFIRDGLDRGERVVAVTGETNIDLLREALGADATRVSFVDAVDWYRHPARTIAGYGQVLDDRAAGDSPVRVIGEVQFGDTGREQHAWVRYEAALNHVFASDRAWIVCPYDVRALPSWVIDQAGATHRNLIRDGQRLPSATYTDPQHLFSRSPARLPRPGDLVAAFSVDGDLAGLRASVREVAVGTGMRGVASDQLTIAVNEAVTNALRHGQPPVFLRLYRDGDVLVAEVEDAGGGMTDLLSGFVPPRTGDEPQNGMGMWLINQLCDHMDLAAGEGRTVVRLSKKVG
jgi:anti-sigma regulatory factor (Ser/Thr protein kinase)